LGGGAISRAPFGSPTSTNPGKFGPINKLN
jgi:hypothetical protein